MSKESLENKILSWSKKFIKSLKDYELIEIIRSENLSKTNSDNIKEFPNYGFDKHKGYPTKLHKEMLKRYGLTRIHRRTFKGVN